jgi:hypothetical protein
VLEPGREPDQGIGDAELGPLFRLEPLVRRRRWMGDEALGVAEVVGDAHELERIEEPERGRLPVRELEGDERRAAAHLLRCGRGLRMVRPTRIDQAADLRMLDQRDRDRGGGVGLAPHPQVQRLQALEQHPGVERGHRRAGLAQEHVHVLLDEILGGEDDAAEAAALAVDVLGGRIDDAIRAERERALPQRRGEHVVDDQRRPGLVRDRGDRADVQDLQRRIGRALEEEGFRARPHRRAPLRKVEPVDQGRGDAEPWQELLDHPAARPEQRLRGHHVVAGPHLPHQRRGDRRHAAGGRAGGFGALEGGHARLEHRHRGVGEPRIDEARVLALEARRAFLGGVVDEALGEKQRLGGLAELGADLAGVDEAGFRAVAGRIRRGHVRPPSANKKPGREKAGSRAPRPFSEFFNVAASRPAQMTTG